MEVMKWFDFHYEKGINTHGKWILKEMRVLGYEDDTKM